MLKMMINNISTSGGLSKNNMARYISSQMFQQQNLYGVNTTIL